MPKIACRHNQEGSTSQSVATITRFASLKIYDAQCVLSHGDGSNMSFIRTSSQSVGRTRTVTNARIPQRQQQQVCLPPPFSLSLPPSHSIDDEELNKLVSAPAIDPNRRELSRAKAYHSWHKVWGQVPTPTYCKCF